MTEIGAEVRVLFVCLGNICRSPTAEGVFRDLCQREGVIERVHIDSAGTGAWHVGEPPDERAREAAHRRGIDLSALRARQVTHEDLARFDYILAMDSANLTELYALRGDSAGGHLGRFLDFAPQAQERDVPDPYYGGDAGFERVLDLIALASLGLLDEIRTRLGPG